MKNSPRDSLYASALENVADFAFDDAVAEVFPDMIQRSVPGYATIIAMIGLLAGRYAQASSRCYDLGCSLGAATLAMRRRIRQPYCRIIAVDNSTAMVQRCRAHMDAQCGDIPVEVLCADIRDVPISDASVVVLNFTLQFIEPAERLEILRGIYDGLRPGGILILSEKLAFDEAGEKQFHVDAHMDFKKANGYSELEISQKRTALENVLRPDSLKQHLQRLRGAGFATAHTWFQCLNFASLFAQK